MAELKRSIRHGQPWDSARANFEQGIKTAEEQYGQHFNPVEWNDDRTSARLTGTGFSVLLRLDQEFVHITGQIPFFLRFLEGPVVKRIEELIHAQRQAPQTGEA